MRYIYKCSNECGYTLEHDCSIEDRALMIGQGCPKCDGAMYKVMGNNGGFRIAGYCEDNGYSDCLGNSKKFTDVYGKQSAKD